jgi:hypothetical protein
MKHMSIDTQQVISTEESQVQAYPCNDVEELLLDEAKPLYAACFHETGNIRIGNHPTQPVFLENDAPRGNPPFEAVLTTPFERHLLMSLLIDAERYTRSDEMPAIDPAREITHYNGGLEYGLEVHRANGDRVSFNVGVPPMREVLLAVETNYPDDLGDDYIAHEQISLSYAEVRHLRELLNRPEVVKLLDQE